MKGKLFAVPALLALSIVASSCSATKPAQTAAATPAAEPVAVEEAAIRGKTVTETTVATTDASVEDQAIQLALKQEADEYRKQVAQDVMTVAMVRGTEMMVDQAMSKAGANNPFTKFVVKAAMDDMKKKAAANIKTAEGAAVMDVAAVLGRARNNNARLGKMVVTVNLLVDKRKQDTVRIKSATVVEKKKFATRLDADEALLALALAASEEELGKIRKASEKDKNKELVAEIETTRRQSARIREAMLVIKNMRKLTQ